jgi:hypothetical protein
MDDITREKIVEAAKYAASEAGKNLSRSDFERITGISQYHIYKFFPKDGWKEVKKLAGLSPHPKETIHLRDEELLSEYHRVVLKLNEIPTWIMFNAHTKYEATTLRRRFGGTQGTLRSYKKWLLINDPNSSLLKVIEKKLQSDKTKFEPVSSPNLQISSDVVEQALADAEQLISTQGALSGVDRVHTAFHGYLLAVIRRLDLAVKKDTELTELFQIIRDNHPSLNQSDSSASEVTKIFRGIAKILESVNQIRNRDSLAHPNQNLLKEPEAMLIINLVRTLLHYLNSKIQNS